MKFSKLFLIKLSPDKIIDESAELYREWYQVPQVRRWSNVGDANWGALTDGCIHGGGEKPTMQDKLMVIAHGTTTYLGGSDKSTQFDAIELAQAFKRWGIDDVGLVSFKCCHAGSGNFLRDFVASAGRYGLKLGWVKGYTAATRTLPGFLRQPYELVNKPDTIFGFNVDLPVFGNDRIKILPGTKPFTVPDSRYLLDTDDR